jgi:hypothetical protein
LGRMERRWKARLRGVIANAASPTFDDACPTLPA